METTTLEPEVLPVIIPVAELEKINATEVGLAEMRQKAQEIASIGVTDRAGYEEAHALTMVAVKVRTETLRMGKKLAAPHKQKAAKILDEAKRIADHAEATEDIVRPLKHAWEGEQQRLKEEAAKAEAAKLAARINNINALGATFDGMTYNVFGVYIDAIEVKALPDDEWMGLYGSARKAYAVEMERLDVIQKEREAEAARLEQQRLEQQAEAQRLRVLAEKQTEQQRQFEAQKAEFERQQAEAENKRLQAIADEQARLRKIEEAEEAERVRIDQQNQRDFQLQQEAKEKAEWEAEQIRLQKVAEVEAKAKLKADKERAERLAPDKKRLMQVLNDLSNELPCPNLTEPETIAFREVLGMRYQELIAQFRNKLSDL